MTYSDNADDQRNKFRYLSRHKKIDKLHSSRQITSLFMAALLIFSTLTISVSFDNSKAFGSLGIRPPEPLVPQGLVNFDKKPSTSIFNIPAGYKMEPVLWNLTLPSTVTFDDNGSMYIAEQGYSYGGFHPTPRILKMDSMGNVSVVADRQLNGPITDIEFDKKNATLYVSHKGIISSVDLTGRVKDLIVGLPSMGDHQNNQIALGPDGRFYFGQGTVTNTGVAGEDSYVYEWLKTSPELHDIPAQNITLTGQNFQTLNPLTPQNLHDYAVTGAYVPFNHTTFNGEVIKGDTKCSGCIISSNANGTDLKVIAWGLRNPYGVAFTADGKSLLVANNGADERGSRPIANDFDKVFKIDLSNSSGPPKYFGWPDYFNNSEPVNNNPKFLSDSSPNDKLPKFLIKDHPLVGKPLSLLGEGVAVTQVQVSKNNSFGFPGMAFVGEYGTAAPLIHPFAQMTEKLPGFNPEIVGQKVLMLNPKTGNFSDFISLKQIDKYFRPVGVKFNPQGDALYVVSNGRFEITTDVPGPFSGVDHYKTGKGLYTFASLHATAWPYANTGVVWKVTKINNNNNTSGIYMKTVGGDNSIGIYSKNVHQIVGNNNTVINPINSKVSYNFTNSLNSTVNPTANPPLTTTNPTDANTSTVK
ncbi:MAG: PQQ-dependent sugar dehydrogenase [Candidatus Nitrosocosmicus sp.]